MQSMHFYSSGNATQEIPSYVGFSAAGVAVVFYGSNFVPVKKFDTQDGMAFQFFVCTAIWFVGLIVHSVRQFPTIHAPVFIGGAMWATGNLCVVPIIQTIGLGLGILIWGTINMLSGWASGRFGMFGIPPQVPSHPMLNYIGVALSVMASSVVFFVTPETVYENQAELHAAESRIRPQLLRSDSDQNTAISVYDDTIVGSAYTSVNDRDADADDRLLGDEQQQQLAGSGDEDAPFWMRMSYGRRKVFGIILSIGSGLFYGLAFVPTYYVQAHVPTASVDGLDYVFSQFTGIFSASSMYFCLYAAVQRNKPIINPRIILPAFASGGMWGVATSAWFLANQTLSESVAFPIITTAPVIVAALWSVLVFHEVKGARNLLLLGLTFAATATGSVLNGLSR